MAGLKKAGEFIFPILAVLLLAAALISQIPSNNGWIRALDMVHEPVLYLCVVLAIAAALLDRRAAWWSVGGFFLAAVINIATLWPFIAIAPDEIAVGEQDGAETLHPMYDPRVTGVDEQGDGYFLSLDLRKGLAQLRAWAYNPHGSHEEAFHYQQLQGSAFRVGAGPHRLSLLAFDQYIELTLNGYVILSLADDQFARGRVGFYSEGARFRADELTLWTGTTPASTEYPAMLEQG